MGKRRRKIYSGPGRQLTFDDLVPKAPQPIEGSLNVGLEVRGLLKRVMKESPKSRYEIAAKMSELLGFEITKHQLDSWTAESRDGWRFPLEYLPAFEMACETHELTNWLAKKRGCRLLIGEEALLAELGKVERMEQEIKERKKALKELLKKRAF